MFTRQIVVDIIFIMFCFPGWISSYLSCFAFLVQYGFSNSSDLHNQWFLSGSFFIELFCGSVYGLFTGFLVILAAKNIAAMLCFLLGKTLLKEYVTKLAASNNLFKWVRRFKFFPNVYDPMCACTHRNFLKETSGSSGLYLVLAGRLSPLPSYVCNYGFSTTDVSLGQYALATFVAGAPMILQVNLLGGQEEK